MEFVVMRNRPLAEVLARAESSELCIIADIITDKGDGRLALSTESKDKILKHKKLNTLQSINKLLAQEICCYGGHALANLFRSDGLEYREVAKDVAVHMGSKVEKSDDTFAIEEKIINIAARHLSTAAMLKAAGSDRINLLTLIIKDLVYSDKNPLERFLTKQFQGGMVTPILKMVLLPGYLGKELSALTSQLRVTIPVVLQIAAMRQRQTEAEYHYYRRSLEAYL